MAPMRFGAKRRFAPRFEVEERAPVVHKPLDGGMDVSIPAWDPRMTIGPVKSPFSENTRIDNGVVSKAWGLARLGAQSAAADKHVMALSEFELTTGTKFAMRVMPAQLERWNGSAWLALTGALTGSNQVHPDTLVVDDLDYFLVANGADTIRRWDGVDVNAVVALSASAPVARLLAFFLGRIIAADIGTGGGRNQERIQISDDTDLTDFAAGNSDDLVIAPDSRERPSGIRGLSLLFKRFYVYRQNSIWEAAPTGVPTSPLTFDEASADVGLIAGKSLDRFDPIGDIFLGTGSTVYVFGGGSRPIPVGLPVQRDMAASITNLDRVYGVVDKTRHEYWLIAPTFGSSYCDLAWVWQIDPWITEQRLVWTRRKLPAEMVSLGEGDVVTGTTVIDAETRLINDITELIDQWGAGQTFRSLLLGSVDGYAAYPGETQFTDEGIGGFEATHDLPQIGTSEREGWIDYVYVEYRSLQQATIQFDYSTDGGTVYGNPVQMTLPAAPKGSTVPAFVGLSFDTVLPRLRFLGDARPEIVGIKHTVLPRGVNR
ncbi:MAG: hypothetical protein GTO63_30020 [Anaerolineae bacterium]|nr:hypothetical protein [Anaerolineae bacterium]NIN98943.1 hypothetical protein [Anaerolineae bacterium]